MAELEKQVLPGGDPLDVDGGPCETGTHRTGEADHEGTRVSHPRLELHLVGVEVVERRPSLVTQNAAVASLTLIAVGADNSP